MGDDLSKQSLLVSFNIKGYDSTDACEFYKEHQLRLHAPGHDPFFADMLKQLGVSSIVRLSGSHYNTPEEIEAFLKVTASMAR